MSARIPRLALAAAALATVAACSEQPAPTAAPDLTPSFGVSDASIHSGAVIIRTDIATFLVNIDVERELLALVTSGNGPFPCAASSEFNLVQFRRIIKDPDTGTDPDAAAALDLLKGRDQFLFLYDWSGLPPITCGLINGPRMGEGTAHYVLTDNDFFAFLRDEPVRANAFGWNLKGTVTLTDGRMANVNAVQKFVFFPPDEVKVNRKMNVAVRGR